MTTVGENKRVMNMTETELLQLIERAITEAGKKERPVEFVNGLDGIAKLFGVHPNTVSKYRREGWIEPAIYQLDGVLNCDKNMAIELYMGRCRKSIK